MFCFFHFVWLWLCYHYDVTTNLLAYSSRSCTWGSWISQLETWTKNIIWNPGALAPKKKNSLGIFSKAGDVKPPLRETRSQELGYSLATFNVECHHLKTPTWFFYHLWRKLSHVDGTLYPRISLRHVYVLVYSKNDSSMTAGVLKLFAGPYCFVHTFFSGNISEALNSWTACLVCSYFVISPLQSFLRWKLSAQSFRSYIICRVSCSLFTIITHVHRICAVFVFIRND